MREIDRLTTERHGIPSLELMENAAGATFRAVTELLGDNSAKRILVLCGKGNNGGDGAATARMLAQAGARVDVVLFGSAEETKGDALTNFQKLINWKAEHAAADSSTSPGTINFVECNSEETWSQVLNSVVSAAQDVIVDALFGTGLTRPVEGAHREAIRYLSALANSSVVERPRIVSIDVPSGLNSDSSQCVGDVVRADSTVTMTAPKPANVLPPAADYNGR